MPTAIDIRPKLVFNQREINKKKLKKKTIDKELDCTFIIINPDKKDFDMDIEIAKIYNHINRSSKKSLVDNITKRILELNLNQII